MVLKILYIYISLLLVKYEYMREDVVILIREVIIELPKIVFMEFDRSLQRCKFLTVYSWNQIKIWRYIREL